MLLTGARVAHSATESSRVDLLIRWGRVFIGAPRSQTRVVNLTGFFILPGLINAHDHLDLNLFPRLGCGPYKNATEWSDDIYHPTESPVREQLAVPKPLRLFWGGIKNLLSGVTSVAHHNPYDSQVFSHAFPVRVVKNYGWAHSIHFSPDWLVRFRRTSRRHPFIIHLAEGTDEQSRRELYELDSLSALGPSSVLVHAVALESKDIELLRRRKASLIWCPTSNLFTLGRTICPAILLSGLPIALGTDSAITADGDLIDELQNAMKSVTSVRLYEMVTGAAARILRLDGGAGDIQSGGVADLLIVRDYGQTAAEALANLQPEAVFAKGKIKLLSEDFANRFRASELADYEKLQVAGRGSFRMPFKLADLIATTERILGGKFTLAGKAVMA